MAATGNEAVKLSQLKTYADSVTEDLNAKLDAPASEGTSGQFLRTDGAGTYTWATVSAGTTYTGTAPISVSGSIISIAEAGDGTQGTVEFASDADFLEYMELSA